VGEGREKMGGKVVRGGWGGGGEGERGERCTQNDGNLFLWGEAAERAIVSQESRRFSRTQTSKNKERKSSESPERSSEEKRRRQRQGGKKGYGKKPPKKGGGCGLSDSRKAHWGGRRGRSLVKSEGNPEKKRGAQSSLKVSSCGSPKE